MSILMAVHWTNVDKYAAVHDVDFDEFTSFVKYFTEHLYIQCLVQGNMTQDTVVENIRQCIDVLHCGPLLPDTMPQLRVKEIPLGSHYCKLKNLNVTDVNSVVTNYYQAGVASDKLSAIIDLLIVSLNAKHILILRAV